MRSLWKSMLALALAVVCAVPAWAEAPVCCASGDHGVHGTSATTDLGKVSPAAVNYSLQPEWQAFVFTRNAVRYIEVADASGLPHAAFTIVSGTVLQLPIGGDVVQQVAAAPASVVYADSTAVVGVVTGADGGLTWQVYVK